MGEGENMITVRKSMITDTPVYHLHLSTLHYQSRDCAGISACGHEAMCPSLQARIHNIAQTET